MLRLMAGIILAPFALFVVVVAGVIFALVTGISPVWLLFAAGVYAWGKSKL